jgi:DNA polymerase elongation subunit (family B)
LAVSKEETQKLDAKRFNLKKLNELEIKKQYQIDISNRFVALENLSDGADINRAWTNISQNIKTSGTEV